MSKKFAVTVVVEIESIDARCAVIEVKAHLEQMETNAEDGERFTIVSVEEIDE